MAAKQKPQNKRRHGAVAANTQKNGGPLLSIGMIFRDDIRCIEKCLEALAPLRAAIPCELVMADTGSEDGSRLVAERYADKLIDFTWIGDFAAARNAVLERCSGQWCLTVDTDEYLEPNINEFVRFLTGTEARQYDIGFVTVRNYGTLEMAEGDYADFYALRLFRRGRRYVGSIHEAIPITRKERDINFPSLIFKHDGYASEIFKDKGQRNLPLLEAEVERDPTSLHRVIQCMESAYTKEQAYKYSCKAVEMLHQQPEQVKDYAPTALREAIRRAQNYGFSEFEEWVSLAQTLCPESPFIWVDVSYMSGIHFLELDPARCLKELERYQEGLKRYFDNEFSWRDLCWGTLRSVGVPIQESARMTMVQACGRLDQWKQALEILGEFHLTESENIPLMGAFLNQLTEIWKKSDLDVAPLLLREWSALKEDDSRLADERRKRFLSIGRALLDVKPEDKESEEQLRDPADLFSALGENCPLGRAALLLHADTAVEAEALLNGVEDWEYIPSRALAHALDLGAVFPGSFYKMPTEIMERHAAGLAGLQKEGAARTVQDWVQTVDEATPGQVMWLYDLTLAAVLGRNWKTNGSTALCSCFREMTLAYLQTFYNPAILSEEWLNLLPQTLRFGWYYLHAQEALDGGDPTTYVRELRKGLKAAPSMKEFVKFLLEQVEQETQAAQQVSEELKALANQVRTILAAYPADHPAVLQIKASPVYQKVAHLLE